VNRHFPRPEDMSHLSAPAYVSLPATTHVNTARQAKRLHVCGILLQLTQWYSLTEKCIPYLRVYKPHFSDKNLPSRIGARLVNGI
jgi:hypothetical protein